jgi:cytidine deaminase
MTDLSNQDLIERALAVVHDRWAWECHVGMVGAALVSGAGNLYVGVCIDAASGMGFCAEHSAIAAMVTAGEQKITRVVAVWRDETGQPHILAPCGRCREFMRQLDPDNIEAEVIVGDGEVVTLRELLPMAGRFAKLGENP